MRYLTNTIVVVSLAAASAAAVACGGSSTSSNVVAPSATVTTDTFNGTVQAGGAINVHSFLVTTPGTVSVTLTAAGPPPTITMGLGLGNPDASGNCVFFTTSNQAIANATTPVFSGAVNASGAYCVGIADIGNALGPITYTITVSHT
jgi:hypothetical protein